jgi:hypothetical protein
LEGWPRLPLKRAQQRLAVDRIRLGAPVASGQGNRRRINDVALDAVGVEHAMNPKPSSPTSWIVTTSTGAAMRCSALVLRKKVEPFAPVTAHERAW